MSKMFNRARMSVTSTGTGTLTLGGPVLGYQSFATAGVANGDTVSYVIEDGANFEFGTGTYTSAGTTLSRTVTQSYNGTTYGTSPISVTTSAQVFITALAADLTSAANITSGTLGVANGGTGLTSLTAGYIPFGAGTSAFGNSANLFWDNTNTRLGIGGTPAARLYVVSPDSSIISLITGATKAIRFGANSTSAVIEGVDNTGVSSYQPIIVGGSDIRFTVSGSEKLRIDSSGNVGIGTSNPGSFGKFASVSGSSYIAFQASVYNTAYFGPRSANDGYCSMYYSWSATNNTDNMWIEDYSAGMLNITQKVSGVSASILTLVSSGNVGIGTTTPSAKLHVLGSGTGDVGVFAGPGGGNFGIIGGFTSGTAYFKGNEGTVAFGNIFAGNTTFLTGNTERMRIDSSGNVGIGTSAPANKFEVYGNDYRNVARASTTAGQSRVEAQASDYWSGSTYIGTSIYQYGSTATGTIAGLSNAQLGSLSFQNVSAGLIFTNGSAPLVFGTLSAERMRIDGSGNVGIGTTSPTAKLDVYGSGGGSTGNVWDVQSAAICGSGTAGAAANNGGVLSFDGTYTTANGRSNFAWVRAAKTNATSGDASGNLILGARSGNIIFTNDATSGGTATERMRLDSVGNLLVGGTAARGTTAGTAHLDLFNGTAPAGTLTNGISLYSSSGDFNFMDASGNGYQVGYRNIPQVGGAAKTGNYTAVLGDSGQMAVMNATTLTYTIPANSSVAYPVGTVLTIANIFAGNLSIAITTDTMMIAGTTTGGAGMSRTLAQNGIATAIKVTSTSWLISGSGLT